MQRCAPPAPPVPPGPQPAGRYRRFPRRAAAAGLTAAALAAGVATAPLAAAAPVRSATPAVVTTTTLASQLSVKLNILLSRDVYQGGIANTVLLTRGDGKLYAYARHERVVTDAALAVVLAPGSARGQAQFLWAWNRLAYGQTIYALAVDRRHPSTALEKYAFFYIGAAEREVALAVHGLAPKVDASSFAYQLSRTDTLVRWSSDLLGAGLPAQYLALESAALSVVRFGVPTAYAVALQRHLAGSVVSAGANVNLLLVLLFQAHVYQTGIASYAGFTFGQFTPAYAGATAALDVNTAQVSETFAVLFGPQAGKDVGEEWLAQGRAYSAFQASLIVPNPSSQIQSRNLLHQFENAEGSLLHILLPVLPARTLVTDLGEDTLGALLEIELQALNNTSQFSAATSNAAEFVGLGSLLAQAIVEVRHLPAVTGGQAGQILGRADTAAKAAAAR